MSGVLFSILMCAYNSEDTIEAAIQSCIKQNHTNWELLILDNNSPDNCVEIIKEFQKNDVRIKYYHLDENVGWAKGTSILLEHASGEYMTFLAADDYFASDDALVLVNEAACNDEKPPVIFVKHQITKRDDEVIHYDKEELDYTRLSYDNALEALAWLIDNWYYNSMFHFMNIGFLRENNIDFYSPYHADNEGMTMSVLKANRFGCINNDIYVLTTDTSQTTGRVTPEYNVELNRWLFVKDYMLEMGIYDELYLRVIAVYFGKLAYDRLKCVCDGGIIADRHMNKVDVSQWERYLFIQHILESEMLNEVHFFDEMRAFVLDFIIRFSLFVFDNKEDFLKRATDKDWLLYLIYSCFDIVDGEVVKKKTLSKEEKKLVVRSLVCDENPYCYGFNLVNYVFAVLNDTDILEICQSYSRGRKKTLDFLKKVDEVSIKNQHDEDHNRILERYNAEMSSMEGFI